jgi:transposase
MRRRQFSREFKLEAVRLVKELGVSVVQAGRDLNVGENILRCWIKEFIIDPWTGVSRAGSGQAGAAGDRSAAA